MLAEIHAPRRVLQGVCIHQPRTAFRQLPLIPFRKRVQEIFPREQFENRVSQELQPLIILYAGGTGEFFLALRAQLGNRGTVSQSALKKFRRPKPVAQAFFELHFDTSGHLFMRIALAGAVLISARSTAWRPASLTHQRCSCKWPASCREPSRTLYTRLQPHQNGMSFRPPVPKGSSSRDQSQDWDRSSWPPQIQESPDPTCRAGSKRVPGLHEPWTASGS